MLEEKDNLKGFRTHGIFFSGESGNQAIGSCPFCGKEKHLYVNKDNRLWDCKSCGEKGNFEDFLFKISEVFAEILLKDKYRENLHLLAEDRGLPLRAFKTWRVGYDPSSPRFTIPIYSYSGKCTDLRMFKIGYKILSTPGAKTGIFGVRSLIRKDLQKFPIYLCEGEWDAMALLLLLKLCGKEGSVCGVPGAGVFKEEWISMFSEREVLVLYDNDAAGENGEIRVQSRLTNVASKILYTHWTSNFPVGYDIRDLIKTVAIKEKDPKRAFEIIHKLLRPETRTSFKATASGNFVPETSEKNWEEDLDPIDSEEMLEKYEEWMHLPNRDVLKIIYGAIFANRLEGDPLWLFLVAPPGGSKSEILMSLSKNSFVRTLTSLTPHTLISGAQFNSGKDPSLLAQLDKKLLVIKDFTTILTMHYSSRDEIFGVLRDAYDGKTEKIFGNGILRSYKAHFGILAGVTPIIETFNIVHASLGERFLKYRITGNWDSESEEKKIRRALSNIGKENRMREELCLASVKYLKFSLESGINTSPGLGDFVGKLINLAKFSATLRGVVDRDRFSDIVMYKPSAEVGTRIAKQLSKLGIGICMFMKKRSVDKEVYELIKRVALDTVPDRAEEVVRTLWKTKDWTPTLKISEFTRLPSTTLFRVLQDLLLLKIVDKKVEKNSAQWKLEKRMFDLILNGGIYDSYKC